MNFIKTQAVILMSFTLKLFKYSIRLTTPHIKFLCTFDNDLKNIAADE
jgi:hypothetical protein